SSSRVLRSSHPWRSSGMSLGAPAVHSLLRLGAEALEWESGAPPWAAESLRQAPWVVVRRPVPRNESLPVGVRGAQRSQRAAAWVSVNAVRECITPQMLAAQFAWRRQREFAVTPAITPAVAALEQA